MTAMILVLFFLSSLLEARDIVNLDVPMVHQRWDVPNWYDGSWGCGPTSAIMSISYHKKLAPHPISCLKPKPHKNSYGYYLPNNYSINGHHFNKMDRDASGKPAWGAYGTCTVHGGGVSTLINKFIRDHGLKTNFTQSGSTLAKVKEALHRGNPVVLDTRLTSAGHIILIRGYDSDDNLICNDPYGNKHKPGYGQYTNGEGVRYTFGFTAAAGHWMVEVSH